MNRKNFLSNEFLVPAFTLVVGLVLIGFSVMRGVETESFVERAEQTTGTVLEAKDGVLVWSAVVTVEFRDADGALCTAKFEPGKETTPLKKGDAVSLLYDPADRSSVYVGDPRHRRYPVLGIYFLIGAGLIFFTVRRLRDGTSWD